jgi:hypothetical protein
MIDEQANSLDLTPSDCSRRSTPSQFSIGSFWFKFLGCIAAATARISSHLAQWEV